MISQDNPINPLEGEQPPEASDELLNAGLKFFIKQFKLIKECFNSSDTPSENSEES